MDELAIEMNWIFGRYSTEDIVKAIEQTAEWGYLQKVEQVVGKVIDDMHIDVGQAM